MLENTAPPSSPSEGAYSPPSTETRSALDILRAAQASEPTAPSTDKVEPEQEEVTPTAPAGTPAKSWEELVAKLSPEDAKLARSLQGLTTKKSQALAAERKALAAEREALSKLAEELRGLKASLAPPASPPAPAHAAPSVDLEDLDYWDPEAVKARVQQERSRAAQLEAELAELRRNSEAVKAEQEYDRFVALHPEVETDKDLQSAMYDLMSKSEHIDLETAYLAALGRRGSQAPPPKEGAPAPDPRRQAQRKAAQAVSAPRAPATVSGPPGEKDLKSMSANDILKWAKAQHGR